MEDVAHHREAGSDAEFPRRLLQAREHAAAPAVVEHEFGWFSIDQLPGLDFGFGQGGVVARVLKKLGRGLASGARRGTGTLLRGSREREKLAT